MHQVFDHKDFYAQLDSDLRSARFLVIIQSPFMTLRRVNSLKHILSDCAARGVRVCVFSQKIDPGFSTQDEYLEKAATLKKVTELLFSIGIHVNLIPKIHEKLVVIDERVFWEGSLNPLSYRDTLERMTRWQCGEKVRSAMNKHNLSKCKMCKQLLLGSTIQSVFGQIIHRWRKMLNMSQQKFSELTGLEQATISRIEKGKFDSRLSTLSKIFLVLQMDCRPIFWYMVSSLDQEFHLCLKQTKEAKND